MLRNTPSHQPKSKSVEKLRFVGCRAPVNKKLERCQKRINVSTARDFSCIEDIVGVGAKHAARRQSL